MKRYEYIRAVIDSGDLEELNRLASTGFHVVGIFTETKTYALLEREIEEPHGT